jgi:D-alanyl-lipoteichoic acid acyltransferase DltB (MBOAT superfamily)
VGIFFSLKTSHLLSKKQTRFFLINQDYSWLILKKHDENKSVKKLRRCVIFYSLILLLYITLYNFPKKKKPAN